MPLSKPEWMQDSNLAINGLLQWLKQRGAVGYIDYVLGENGGVYDSNNRNIRVSGANRGELNKTGAHEAVHAISYGDLPSRTQQILDNLNDMGPIGKWFAPEIVPAKNWDKINPKLKETNPLSDTAKNVTKRREQVVNDVVSSIPEGEAWSGLRKDEPPSMFSSGGFDEALAHYFTNPQVKGDPKTRLKEFAAFLRDRGVPWDNIDNLLSSMQEYATIQQSVQDTRSEALRQEKREPRRLVGE